MPLHTEDAVVLTRFAFREKDLVVVVLTRESGQQRFVARRARAGRAPVATALEPLAVARVTYAQRSGSEMATLREARLVRSPFPLAVEPVRWAAAQVIAEIALACCPPGQRMEAAFRLVDLCLLRLAEGHSPLAAVHYAQLWFLRLSGVLPEFDRCGACGRALAAPSRVYAIDERVFVCDDDRPAVRSERLGPAAVRWLERAMHAGLPELAEPCPADGATWLAGLQRVLVERELKSWAFLQSLT